MKKRLVALAVLAAVSGAALAQSSVTVYGILDLGYQWNEVPAEVGTTAAPRIEQESYSAINGSHVYGNRWGLRGSEDLGGGWRAIFTLESGFNVDTGTAGQGGRLFGRQAFVGVDGGLGTLVAGRLATFSSGTGSFDMFSHVDPFVTGFGLAGLANTFISANALRVDNAIAYRSPKFAGFQGGIGYSANFSGAEQAPSGENTTAFISGLTWETGPFYAVVTYDAIDPADSSNRPSQKHLQIGGTFDISAFRLHAAYADQSNIGSVAFQPGLGSGSFVPLPAGVPYYDSASYMLGATWTIGEFAVLASYQWADADGQATAAGANFEPDYNIWGIGGTWNLSRRTMLYTSYASRDADGSLLGDAFNAKQFAVGLVHRF
jgi:predicted porin